LEIVKRKEHEYKQVRAKRLTNLYSCPQFSRLEEVPSRLADGPVDYWKR